MNDASSTSTRDLALLERLDAAASRLETPCGDGALVWRSWGEGPALVFLHGGFGSWMHWVLNIEPFAAGHGGRYRVLALDLPGLGESALPPEPVSPQSLGAIVRWGLEQLLDDGDRPHLIGFSFGALVGGQVAAQMGERARSFTLVGAAGMGIRRPPMELVKRTPEMSDAEVTAALRRNAMTLMLHDERNLDELAFHIHVTNDRNARLRSRRMSLGDSLGQVLPDIRTRLNGIWGEFDATVGREPGMDMVERPKMLRAVDPQARFEVVAGAGHWVQYEGAAGFNAALARMLEVAERDDG